MTSLIRAMFRAVLTSGRRFGSDARGNVAIIFGLSSVMIVAAVGAGIDLSGAYAARQRLSEVATLTCQYSVRQSVINTQSSNAAYAAAAATSNPTNTFPTYLATVNQFAVTALGAQHLTPTNVTASDGSAPTNSTTAGNVKYFTATNGANGPTGGIVDMTMVYKTYFLTLVSQNQFKVHALINCASAPSTPQIVTPSSILQASFETSCTVYCFTLPSGVPGALENPTTTFGTTPTYVDPGGFSFYVIGYCLEVDYQGVINATDPDGTHSAELDCDNASGTAGNSSISTRVFLNAGNYELRYFYRSRIDQAALDPFYICGWTNNDPTKVDDLSWVNQTNFPTLGTTSAMRTNQMNVYLDPTTATAYPPLHYTNYGTTTQQLAGSNLIDACVYSYKWVERSVTINVSASGYFWLSFAADGQNDSYGAQLDDIKLCPGTCAGAPQDNFPDTTPQTQPVEANQSVPLALALATQATWGWNNYIGTAGTLITPLCGATAVATLFSSCSTNPTRDADTTVLLDPGFYELSYKYQSLATFAGAPVTGCDSTPAATDVSSLQNKTVTATDPRVLISNTYSTKADVDMVGVFLSFPGQTLTPNVAGAATTTNPLIDLCYYSTTALTRKIGIQITKPGLYDLTYYAAGTATSKYLGGAVGTLTSMSLTAIGSPYQYAMSANCPAAPVPAPQVGSPITPATGTGYTTTSTDPFLQGASMSACAPP